MKIILTNDDGFGAPGLEALIKAAEGLGEIIVVAPDRQYSGCGHQVTTHTPIAIRQLVPQRFMVSGTPADCTRIALQKIAPEASLLLSGINAGGNMGVDVFISGTVAAAREAVLLGVPAVAISQYRRRDLAVDWERTARWAQEAILRVVDPSKLRTSAANSHSANGAHPPFWNINFPYLPEGAGDPEMVHCDLDLSPLPVSFHGDGDPAPPEQGAAAWELHYAGEYDARPRVQGRDIDICLSGRIALTAVKL